jgi:hypothetical protein
MLLLSLPILLHTPVLAPRAQEPLAAHPADAAVLVQIPDVGALIEAYGRTAYGRILSDEALHAALGQVLGAPEPVDPREMIAGQWQAAVEEGAPPVDRILQSLRSLSLSLSVPGGDIARFIQEGQLAELEEQFIAENMTVRVVMDFADAAGADTALASLKEGLGAQGVGFKVVTKSGDYGRFGGAPVERWQLELGPGAVAESVRLFKGGPRIVLLAGGESDEVALARMQGAAADAEATGASVVAAARRGFGDASGTVFFEAHIEPFAERLALAQDPMALPALDIVEALGGPLASMLVRGGDWRVQIVDGQFITDGTYPRPTESPLAGLLGAKALDPQDLALVLPDAIVAGALSFDKNVLLRFLSGIVEREGGESQLEELDAAFGFRPDRDLIAPLGDAIAYSMPPLTSFLSAPPFALSLDVADLEAFSKGMDGVFTMLEQMGGDEFQLARSEYKGVRLYTVSFAGAGGSGGMVSGLPIDLAGMIRPTIAIGQGRAFLMLTPNLSKKEVRRVDKLGDQLELHPALTAGVLPEGATEVGYANWAEFLGKVYAGVKGLAPMLGAMGGELPFDLANLPDGELVTRHIGPSLRSKRILGRNVVVHGSSPFGPEAVLLIGGGAFSLGATAAEPQWVAGEVAIDAVRVEEDPTHVTAPEPPTTDPAVKNAAQQLTSDSLMSLSVDLTVHRFDKGAYPASLAGLGQAAPKDGWGRDFVYKLKDDAYELYSLGPNGVDDGGKGDDVLPTR